MTGLTIAGRTFGSRLLVGTGKFASNQAMAECLAASGTEIVTVALRRADLTGKDDPYADILNFIDPKKYLLLPNTSGAMNAAEAVRLARLAAAAGLPKWVKLEIHPDPRYLLPDPIETLAAAEQLVKEGFIVLPYINADPVLPSACRKSAPPPSCRWLRPSAPTAGSKRAASWKSSSSKRPSRSSSMRASARPRMRRPRWNSAPTACWSTPRWPRRAIPPAWPGPSGMPSRRPHGVGNRLGCTQPHRKSD